MKLRRFIAILFITTILLIGIVSYKLFTIEKFIYINRTKSNDAEIIIVDPLQDKMTKYLVTADTEMNSARGYGNYKLSSLWALSEKDEIRGKLITETILKNYSLPVFLWRNESKSNLSFLQKLKTHFINNKKSDNRLIIGSRKISNSILINFVEKDFVDITPKIDLEDLTGSLNTVENISRTIEIIGGKIASNSKGYEENLDCEIIGKNSKTMQIFVDIFSCDSNIDDSINTDLKIRLGAKFAKRF